MTIQIPTVSPKVTTAQAMWALGDYALMADQVMAPLGPVLVAAADIGPGDRVLDVAAGSGNVSIPAAKAGATVISSDLTPELLVRSQSRAAAHGVTMQWREADAQLLPFGDGEFDCVVSAIGVMFAPDHRRALNEMIRVCRPGGTIGVISWAYDGFFGQMLNILRPYEPAVQPGTPLPTLWGREDYAIGLFGSHLPALSVGRGALSVERFDTPLAVLRYFKSHYGPTINAYRAVKHDLVLTATLDAQLIDLTEQYLRDGLMNWEYLLVTAQKR